MNILDQLAEHARQRVEAAKQPLPLAEIKRQALSLPKGDFRFEKALAKPGLAFICECKKASPSKGLIAPEFPYLQIAREYEAAGADAISVLTEPKWFIGSDAYLKEITSAVSPPCLRKDFTVDAYMIYEAKLLGASAVLLICAILNDAQLKEYLAICEDLGLSALVEAHDDAEVDRALAAGARILGVNNRNLKTFTVDTENSRRLRARIPQDVLFVSESGVKTAEDVARLAAIGAAAVLIGEPLMRAPDKTAKLRELIGLLRYDQDQILRPDPCGGYRGGKRAEAGIHRLCVCPKEQALCQPNPGRPAETAAGPRHPGGGRVREGGPGDGGPSVGGRRH